MPHIALETDTFPNGVDRFVLRLVIRAYQQLREQAHQEELHGDREHHDRDDRQRRLDERRALEL